MVMEKRIAKSCKVDKCTTKHASRGFCARHYGDWKHERRDFDGKAINNYVPRPEVSHCRFPECSIIGNKLNGLKRGLCGRHRKWATKGIIDLETCKILDPKRIPKIRKGATCKVMSCSKKHKALGFCQGHYKSFTLYKTVDEDGNHIGKRQKYTLNSRCKINTCSHPGRLVKGFCRKHYHDYTENILSLEGYKIRDLKRVAKYPEGAKCKGANCRKRPQVNWFCDCCWAKTRTGSLDMNGKKTSKHLMQNKGKKCSDKDCQREAESKGLCPMHYGRILSGYVGPAGYKNVGQTCSMDNCNKPAEGRTMCSRHYRQALRVEQGRPVRTVVNKNKMCRVDHCSNKAASKLLCEAHNNHFRNIDRLDILNDLQLRPVGTLKQNITINPHMCITLGCSQKPKDHNLCPMHLSYFRLYQPAVLEDLIKTLSNLNRNSSCRVTGCFNKTKSHKLCSTHYDYFREHNVSEKSWKNDKKLDTVFKKLIRKDCKLIGCRNAHTSNGYCERHTLFFSPLDQHTEHSHGQ